MGIFGSKEPRVVEELTAGQRLHVNAWTIFSVGFGALLGIRLAVSGWHPAVAILGGMIVMPIFVRLMLWLILSVSSAVARQLYNPGGGSVRSRPAYSGPESLAVRGRFEEAIVAYQAAAEEEPDDPEPWLRIARIERMDLRRPQRAVEALRAARQRAPADSPTAMLISRQIAEAQLADPATASRAMPELARLAAAFPQSPTGAWAAQQLRELKARLAAGEFDHWVKPPGSPADEPGGSGKPTSPEPG